MGAVRSKEWEEWEEWSVGVLEEWRVGSVVGSNDSDSAWLIRQALNLMSEITYYSLLITLEHPND